jgi:hypothetical protein
MVEAIIDIPFELYVEEFFERLRVKPGSKYAKDLGSMIDHVKKVAKPKAIYRESYIEAKGEETVTIDGITFTSRVLRRNLDKVERVFPYVATCGKEVDGIEISQGDFLKSFWLDTIKSHLLEISIHTLSELLDRKYRLGNTSSMSPGAGDAIVWPIEQQMELFSLFDDIERLIGVRLTDSFLMLPTKSLSGIRFQTEIDFRSCQLCYRKNCVSRMAPFDKELWDSIKNEQKA